MSNYSRSRTRKFLYQLLFASTFSKVNLDEFMQSFYEWVFEATLDEQYLNTMYDLILKNEKFLITLVNRFAPKFKIEDMDLSYVLPIFIGMTEVLYYPEEIPLKVSLNEAVEIAKVYGDDPAKRMVNGVLYNFSKDLELIVNESKDFDFSIEITEIFKK